MKECHGQDAEKSCKKAKENGEAEYNLRESLRKDKDSLKGAVESLQKQNDRLQKELLAEKDGHKATKARMKEAEREVTRLKRAS